MEANERIFKAGLALDLTVRVTGGIEYQRTQEGTARVLASGARVEAWATEKTTQNPLEHGAAVEARAAIRNSITRLCARTPLGDLLLVPPDREEELKGALEAASVKVRAHNAGASHHFLVMGAILTRFQPDDAWTVKSLRGEIMACLGTMEAGIAGGNPDRIRDACDSAKKILPMLSGVASLMITAAIDQAREAAREITRRCVRGDDDMGDVIAEIQAGRSGLIEVAKVSFLDTPEA